MIARVTPVAEAVPTAAATTPPQVQTGSRNPLPFGIHDVLLFLMAAVWGANFVVLKIATEIVPGTVFNLIRFIVGLASLGAILALSGQPLALPRRDWGAIVKVSVISTLIYQTFFMAGLKLTTAANSSLIIASAPVLLVLFNVVMGKDRIGRLGIAGVLLAFAGVAFVMVATHADGFSLGGDSIRGDLLMLGAACAWVCSVLVSREPIQRNSPLTFSFWHAAGMTILQVFIAAADVNHVEWSTLDYGSLILPALYSGLGAFCIAALIWNVSVRKIGTTRTAIYTNLQPIIAALAGMIVLNEPFTPLILVGCVLVLIGVLLVKRG